MSPNSCPHVNLIIKMVKISRSDVGLSQEKFIKSGVVRILDIM